MNRCDKCGFLHYRTDPCRKPKPAEPQPTPKPKRSGNRHRPGYFTEYMRDYRKGILRRPKPTTKREKDE